MRAKHGRTSSRSRQKRKKSTTTVRAFRVRSNPANGCMRVRRWKKALNLSDAMFPKLRTAILNIQHPAAGMVLGDFTMTPRVLWIGSLAIFIGFVTSYIALALLKLIALFTNLFFYQRWAFSAATPAGNRLGVWEVLVPVVGAVIVGLMARFGSERIRGHGIPEAIEAILINGSKVEPKVALLKPISSAISIGSGGPFGAEGPIIMTGGAFGSMVAQLFKLSSTERKTLLVAGAAAGMCDLRGAGGGGAPRRGTAAV